MFKELLKELIKEELLGGEKTQTQATECPFKAGDMVIVRSSRSGVDFGELVSLNGNQIVLKNAIKFWSYTTANEDSTGSVFDLATKGAKTARITDVMPLLLIMEKEFSIIPVSEKAIETFKGLKNE